MEIRQITPFFIYFIYVWIWKYSKFIFMRSILVCKMPQFLTKSYQLEELIIFFKKIFIIFCPPGGATYQFCSLYLMNYYSYVKYNPQCFWLDDCPLDKVVATKLPPRGLDERERDRERDRERQRLYIYISLIFLLGNSFQLERKGFHWYRNSLVGERFRFCIDPKQNKCARTENWFWRFL